MAKKRSAPLVPKEFTQQPAKKTYPSGPVQAVEVLEEQGLVLRMRAVARLEKSGLPSETIATELAKSDKSWTHDLVLALQGKVGTPEQQSAMSSRYQSCLEDVSQGNLIEPESDIKELLAYAMRVITTFIKSAPENACPECGSVAKDAVDAAFKVLRAGGLGLGENVSIVEYRMDADTRDVLRAVTAMKKAQSRLGPLIEAEFSGKDS